jgi:hypothetical protein
VQCITVASEIEHIKRGFTAPERVPFFQWFLEFIDEYPAAVLRTGPAALSSLERLRPQEPQPLWPMVPLNGKRDEYSPRFSICL